MALWGRGGRRKGKRLRNRRKKQERETLPKLALSDGSGADLIKHLCRNACWEVRLMAGAVRVWRYCARVIW